jgi:hypothetical protein
MEFPHGVGNFLGTKILPLKVFLNLIFQIIHPFGDVGDDRVDGPPPQGTGGFKAAAAGNQDVVIGQYDGADLSKPFHAVRQGINIAHVFTEPLFYFDIIDGDLHFFSLN